MTAARPILNLAVAAAIALAPTGGGAQEVFDGEGLNLPGIDPGADPGTGGAPGAIPPTAKGGEGELSAAPDAVEAPAGQTAAERTTALLADLARPDNAGWRRVERQLLVEWGRSGSAAMDLLLQRGREALREDDLPTAIDHLTALTDHAPEFAEGWNQRASAYFRAGQYGPAMYDLSRAVALNPKHFGALSGLGVLLAETGNKEGARDVYLAVLAIHPNLATVRDALTRLDQELSGQKI